MSLIRIGLIGCGGIVKKTHLPCLLRLPDQVQIVAVADPIAVHRDIVGDGAGVDPKHRFEDFLPLLENVELDLVLVATPHDVHESAIIAAVTAGIAVVSEKPMSPDIQGARHLLTAITETKVSFSVVHNFLYSPGIAEALRRLRESPPAGEDSIFARGQSMFAKEEPLDPIDWRSRAETGGGALNDTCYHEIYLVEALVGSQIKSVQAHISTAQHQISADDLVLLTFAHENGVRSTINSAWSVAGYEGTFSEVHTNHRAFRVEGRGRRLRSYSRTDRHWEEIPLDFNDEPGVASGHFGFWQACLKAFRASELLPISPQHALRQVAILEAARESSRRGGVIIELDD